MNKKQTRKVRDFISAMLSNGWVTRRYDSNSDRIHVHIYAIRERQIWE